MWAGESCRGFDIETKAAMPKEVQQHVEGYPDPAQREKHLPLRAHNPDETLPSAMLRSAGQAGYAWITYCGDSCRITLRRPLWTFNPPLEPS